MLARRLVWACLAVGALVVGVLADVVAFDSADRRRPPSNGRMAVRRLRALRGAPTRLLADRLGKSVIAIYLGMPAFREFDAEGSQWMVIGQQRLRVRTTTPGRLVVETSGLEGVELVWRGR